MTRRSITALAVAATMTLAACGGGGSDTLSEDDFIDEVNGLCADANDDLDDIDEPEELSDVVDFASDSSEIFSTLRDDLGELSPPDDLADDYADALDAIDEIIELLGDFEQAADDDDQDEAFDIGVDLGGVSDELEGLAEDLGVDDCIFADAASNNEPVADGPVTTAAPETVPPTTAAPITLPPTVPPATPAPTTAPPVTEPPATEPPATEAPAETLPDTGALFSVVDLTTVFNDPIGFTLIDTGMGAALPFIEIVADVPILNIGIDEMGVAAMIDSFGDSVATLVVGVSLEGFGMPQEWKTLICTPEASTIRTTPAGYTGVYCPGPPGSGLVEILTITDGDLGITIGLIDSFYFVDDLVDAFLLANF